MLKKLLPFFRDYRLVAILSPLLVLVTVAGDVLQPFLMAAVVNEGVLTGDTTAVAHYGLLMIAVALATFVAGGVASFLGARAGQGFAYNLRQGLFERITGFSFRNLDHFGSATLITRLTSDTNRIGQVVDMTLRMAVRAPVMFAMATVMSFRINSELALVFLIGAPILFFLLILIVRFAFPNFSRLQQSVDRLNQVVNENLSAIRVVKGFVREDRENQKFAEVNRQVRDIAIRIFNVVVFSMPLMFLVMYTSMIAILWFGGAKIQAGSMLAGDLIGFISYVTQIFFSLTMMTMLLVNYVRAKASAVRCLEVLDTVPGIVGPVDGVRAVPAGDIEFERVSFRYDGMATDQLSDVSLKIAAGSTVGIIGSTGSSKTTLVSLILRLYDVDGGVVRVGGIDVRDYDLVVLRDAVSMVLQKNTLFSGTVRENLAWGKEDADDKEMRQVLAAARALDFIEEREGGLNAEVEAGGVNFSGGQRQRLTIARALLKAPKILILDDAMSAVDMATERELRRTLKERLAGTTVIIIAQRIASVEDADQIIVLDEGRIDGVGDHHELLETNAIYREIALSQLQGLAG